MRKKCTSHMVQVQGRIARCPFLFHASAPLDGCLAPVASPTCATARSAWRRGASLASLTKLDSTATTAAVSAAGRAAGDLAAGHASHAVQLLSSAPRTSSFAAHTCSICTPNWHKATGHIQTAVLSYQHASCFSYASILAGAERASPKTTVKTKLCCFQWSADTILHC
jgi:hypothetical protein